MLAGTYAVGLRLTLPSTGRHLARLTLSSASKSPRRTITTALFDKQSGRVTSRTSQYSSPPSSTSSSSSSSSSTTPSSFFTPSLCRTSKRYASTAAAGSAVNTQAVALDWNTFFRLRTSRRRYALASSIISALLSTGGSFVFLSTQPDLAEQVTKLIPTDPFVSLGILTFGATLLGWLLGPVFGNAVWRLSHRARLTEFTSKEKAFFERIKRRRVNPSGASANNPVPDFYGEKIGSVAGYRRWLKDQRAFNRKRDGLYTAR